VTRLGDRAAVPAQDAALTVEDVARMDDAALEAEVTRRRRRRLGRTDAGGTGNAAAAPRAPTRAVDRVASLRRGGLAQAYANLELAPGAPLDAVRRRYLELLARYDPTRFDGERRRLAEGLVEKLRDAYETVRGALGPADASSGDSSEDASSEDASSEDAASGDAPTDDAASGDAPTDGPDEPAPGDESR